MKNGRSPLLIDTTPVFPDETPRSQSHIDPPGELNTNPQLILIWIVITIIGLTAIGLSVPLIQRWRHRQLPRPL